MVCNKKNISVSELAKRIGQTPQNFGKKLKRDTVTFEEMMAIAEALNVKYEQAFVLADETKISMGSYKVKEGEDKMKNILLGNGINIQFGGLAYSSDFIMKRIKYNARLDRYERLFCNTVTGNEIEKMLNSFVTIANDIIAKKYDNITEDLDTIDAIKDFQSRYTKKINLAHEIMLEDWFLVVHLFFLENADLEDNRKAAVQGFEQLLLDAIFNDGKIQELYTKMNNQVKKYFNGFDNIFTLNYDNNIEKLIHRPVYHLHGDFSVLANSENVENVLGYIRTMAGETVWFQEMKQCYCNALLNYSGKLKYKFAETAHDLIVDSEQYAERYENDASFRKGLEEMKKSNSLQAQMIMTKIEHPELKMATEYYFDVFKTIQGELHIVGMSPNNDAHIFELILNSPNITKVVFYYFNKKEREYIEANYPKDLFECQSVQDLWKMLNCSVSKYNCNYNIPDTAQDIIRALNLLSDDKIGFDEIKNRVNQVPQFEMIRLCKAVKEDMKRRNPLHESTDKKDFIQQNASICYIALKEGILPSVLYLICIMNFQYIKD